MSTPLHILIVDDRPDSVLILTEFLLSRGHRVETASNGQAALEAVLLHQRSRDVYHLVISDVTMPVMDGLTMANELRRRLITVPMVLYTAFGAMHPTLNQQAVVAGVMAVLDKPIELRRVETLIEEVVARRTGTGTARRTSASADQPFFGTARVVRPSSTRVERRDPDTASQTATGALERRRSEVGYAGDARVPQSPLLPPLMMPVPSPLPFLADNTPLPDTVQSMPPIRTPLPVASTPHNAALIPPTPLRTPLPVAMPKAGPPLAGPSPLARPATFQTPIPGAPHMGGLHRPASMRTPLPFLTQPPAPPTDMVPPPPPPPVPIRTPLPNQPAQPIAGAPGNQVGQYPTTSFLRRSVGAPVKGTGYVRRPSGLFLNQPDQPGQPMQPTTSRLRRGVTGNQLPPQTASFTQAKPPAATGPAPATASRAVACAHCRKVFMVAVRRDAYTAVCAHCGQLNRIDPL